MKEFVKRWSRSVQVKKQRKYRYNAPLHILADFMNVNISKELRAKLGRRNVGVRKGDKIKVMRGQHKGKTGKIEKVSLKYQKVNVTGIEIIRKDGTKSMIPIHPSKIQIIELDKSGKKRFAEGKNGKKSP